MDSLLNSDSSSLKIKGYQLINQLEIESNLYLMIYEKEMSHLQVFVEKGSIVAIYFQSDVELCIEQYSDFNLEKNVATIENDEYVTFLYLNDDNSKVNSIFMMNYGYEGYLLAYDTFVLQITHLINFERILNNQQKLLLNIELSNFAKIYSQQIIKDSFFSHIDIDGKSAYDRVNEGDGQYKLVGENLARGKNMNAYDAHNKLMNSLGHKKNIISSSYQALGLGFSIKNDEVILCELFTK